MKELEHQVGGDHCRKMAIQPIEYPEVLIK